MASSLLQVHACSWPPSLKAFQLTCLTPGLALLPADWQNGDGGGWDDSWDNWWNDNGSYDDGSYGDGGGEFCFGGLRVFANRCNALSYGSCELPGSPYNSRTCTLLVQWRCALNSPFPLRSGKPGVLVNLDYVPCASLQTGADTAMAAVAAAVAREAAREAASTAGTVASPGVATVSVAAAPALLCMLFSPCCRTDVHSRWCCSCLREHVGSEIPSRKARRCGAA